MPHKVNLPTAVQFAFRALLLRCPACGTKPLFLKWYRVRHLRDWFTPLDGCPRCGYPYEREAGYFLMAIWAVNYTAAAVLGLILYAAFEWFFEWPIWTLIGCVLVPVLIFSLGFIRHSKAIWLALDLFFDPHDRSEGDDDGDQLLTPPSGGNSPTAHEPEPVESLTGSPR